MTCQWPLWPRRPLIIAICCLWHQHQQGRSMFLLQSYRPLLQKLPQTQKKDLEDKNGKKPQRQTYPE